jgi:PAS domain S-box-containing protein
MFWKRTPASPPCTPAPAPAPDAAAHQRIRELEARLATARQTEQQLAESRQRYKSLFDYNLDAVITTDRDGRILTANPAAERLGGYTAHELTRMTLAQLPAPDSARLILQHFNRALLGDPNDFETTIIAKDGRRIDVYVTGGPLIVGGQTVGVFAIAKDITERKRLDAAAQQGQEERYRRLFENTADAVFVTGGSDYRLEDVNSSACAMFGYTRDELIGRLATDLSAEPERARANMAAIRAGGGERHVKRRQVRHKDGTVFPVEFSAGTFISGGETKIIFSVRDIRERTRLEREVLEISQRERHHVGRTLHESIGERLAKLAAHARALAHRLAARQAEETGAATALDEQLGMAVAEVHALVRLLQPVDLEAHSLVPALQELAALAERLFGIRCRLEAQESLRLANENIALQLYRIAQEGISHAARHHGVKELQIGIAATDGQIILRLQEGPPGVTTPPGRNGHALRLMQYRAEMIGGTLDVRPGPTGHGPLITCTVPQPGP